jgi:predicted HD superfamily hydrolase involved in NAD metabolism
MKTDHKQIEQQLKKRMTQKLFVHSLATAKQAKELAIHWHMGGEKAYLAGLLHDHAKMRFVEELVPLAVINNISIDSWLLNNPKLLHGPVGAVLLASEWNILDKDIKEAISCHTIATKNMSDFAKIIYLADKIEPNRNTYPALDKIRALAYSDLDAAMAEAINSSIMYLESKAKELYPNSKEIAQFYRNKIQSVE